MRILVLLNIWFSATAFAAGFASPERQLYLGTTAWIPSSEAQFIALAEKITLGSNSDKEKIKRIHNWVAENFVYDDKAVETGVIGPTANVYEMLKTNLATCGGYSAMAVTLLRAVKIPARVVNGFADGNAESREALLQMKNANGRGSNHIWTEVYLDGKWLPMDITWDSLAFFDKKSGGMLVKKSSQEFSIGITLEKFQSSHEFVGELNY